jgi:hypothetical protein
MSGNDSEVHMRGVIAVLVLTAVFSMPAAAGQPVSIRIASRTLPAPGYLRVLVYVEPDAANRALTIEVDGEPLFRSSEVALAGAKEKRAHQFEVKDLKPGEYVVRAVVRGGGRVRGTSEERVIVFGI